MLNRRFMLSQANAQPAETWDDEWHFSQGLLENSGFMNGSGITEMTELGEQVDGSKGLIKFENSRFSTVEKGVAEVEVIFKSFSQVSDSGFRLLLSNGSFGCQLFCYYDKILYNKGNQNIPLNKLGRNQIYKIKNVFNDSGVNKIYLDDALIYESKDFSRLYVVGNKIFQQNGGTTILRSLKYKYNRI